MGCTYSALRFVDSSNIKPKLVYIDPSSEEVTNKPDNDSDAINKVRNKPKNAFKKIYAF